MDTKPLHTQGFVKVNYPSTLRAVVAEAMASWQEFCKLPDEKKRSFSGGNDRVKDFGYMKRQDKVGKADDKELFEVKRQQLEEMARLAKEIGNEKALAFIHAVDRHVTETVSLVQAFAASVEREYGLGGFEKDVIDAIDNWTFRYIHYFPGENFAHAHADRGGFTLHLFETAGGGEYLSFDNEWLPFPVSAAETIIFPSLVLQERSNGVLAGLWHRVNPNKETLLTGRFSMVLFVDFANPRKWNDGKYRVQNLEPGFNYGRRPDQFPEPDMFVKN